MCEEQPVFPTSRQPSLLPDDPHDPGPVPLEETAEAALTRALVQLALVLSDCPETMRELNELRTRAQVAAMEHPAWHWVAVLSWTAKTALQELQAFAASDKHHRRLNPGGFPLSVPGLRRAPGGAGDPPEGDSDPQRTSAIGAADSSPIREEEPRDPGSAFVV